MPLLPTEVLRRAGGQAAGKPCWRQCIVALHESTPNQYRHASCRWRRWRYVSAPSSRCMAPQAVWKVTVRALSERRRDRSENPDRRCWRHASRWRPGPQWQPQLVRLAALHCQCAHEQAVSTTLTSTVDKTLTHNLTYRNSYSDPPRPAAHPTPPHRWTPAEPPNGPPSPPSCSAAQRAPRTTSAESTTKAPRVLPWYEEPLQPSCAGFGCS